jgi:cytochrome bd ubiquinol oxidase subunit II
MDDVRMFLIDIWLVFLGLFLTFYVVLDGFDLGIGVLSLFVRERERRGIMVASLSSVWDANETWLVVLGGALFGAFPLVYGIVLNALYLPVIVMIFALIFRGVAFEFREQSRQRLWDFSFGMGSLLAALCQGFVLGGLISGPTVQDGRFAGGPFDWFSPFSVLVALGVLFGYVLLGATYLIVKTEGDAQEHGVRTAWIAGALMLLAAAGVSIWTPIRYPFVADKWFGHGIISAFVIPPIFALFCAAMLARGLRKRQEYAPFVWSIGIFLASLIGLASSLYPYLVPRSVTAVEAAADSLTLVFMMLGIGLLIPVMITYNA